jgi:hypothetical protein
VTTGRDEDALSWDGDDDPTLDLGSSAVPGADTSAGREAVATAAGAQDEASVRVEQPAGEAPDAHDRTPMGNGTLIALGVMAGMYALFAIGWLIGGLRLQGRAQYLVLDVMYQGSLWLAVLAPLLWFATTLLLTRRSRPWVRFTWLAVGVVLLLPWPFVMIGAIGQ